MIDSVTLDATQTLFHCPRLGEIHAEILGRHGLNLDPDRARQLVAVVWQEFSFSADPARERFGAHPQGERGWWQRFVARLFEHAGARAPSPFAFSELFHRFSLATSYEVYPEVPKALAALRRIPLRLAVVSNWDHRLPGVLDGLGLTSYFDAIVFSAAVGMEKPHPRIFHAALERIGGTPRTSLHVGDGRLEDVEGAVGAGLRALHLLRTGGGGDLSDLSTLPDLILAERAGKAGRDWAGAVLGC